jgi:hypothetical protein
MALRFEKGKLRPQPPRLKEVARRKRTEERNRNQDAKGRFVAGNRAPEGRRLKAIIRRHLGKEAVGITVEVLFTETKEIFKALVKAVGSEAPQVQDTLARRARWGVLSAHYALRAAELGLETKEGQTCLEIALKLDARTERLDVTALDLANRLDDRKPDEGSSILDAIDAAGRAAVNEAEAGSELEAPAPQTEAGGGQ